MEAYDSATRVALQSWTLDNRRAISEVHLAIRSRLTRMGVTVANLALGNFMKTYDNTEALAEIYLEVLAKHRRTPPR
jgi:hypothetical protein